MRRVSCVAVCSSSFLASLGLQLDRGQAGFPRTVMDEKKVAEVVSNIEDVLRGQEGVAVVGVTMLDGVAAVAVQAAQKGSLGVVL